MKRYKVTGEARLTFRPPEVSAPLTVSPGDVFEATLTSLREYRLKARGSIVVSKANVTATPVEQSSEHKE